MKKFIGKGCRGGGKILWGERNDRYRKNEKGNKSRGKVFFVVEAGPKNARERKTGFKFERIQKKTSR